jgi:hypothetical protein
MPLSRTKSDQVFVDKFSEQGYFYKKDKLRPSSHCKDSNPSTVKRIMTWPQARTQQDRNRGERRAGLRDSWNV